MGKNKHKHEKRRSRSRSRSRDRSVKRKKRRHRSSSEDSPDPAMPRLTADEIEVLKEDKKRQKQRMKELETPEEKRARRLTKKEAKERKRKAAMGWDEEYMGYTNIDNPFGDEHLLDTFAWGKKLEQEGLNDLEASELTKMQRTKMIANKMELEKVKKRRMEREREREERIKEREDMQREKEAEYYREWEKQEDTFHLQQAKLRSKIRIEDGRAKPIDLLARYISAEDEEDVTIEMHEPYTYLNGLTISDLEDLLADIKVYVELEQGRNVEYWRDITIITEEELNKLYKMDPTSRDYVGDRRSGINQSVVDDIARIFKGKSLKQLEQLEKQIRAKLQGGEGVDIGYWESLSQQLKAHMARMRLRERHQDQLKRKLLKLKEQQGIGEDEGIVKPEVMDSIQDRGERSPEPQRSPQPSTSKQEEATTSQGASDDEAAETDKKEAWEESIASGDAEEEAAEEDGDEQRMAEFLAGSYSPVLLSQDDLEPDTLVFETAEEAKRLEIAQESVIVSGKARRDADDDLMRKARAGMTDEEAQFSVEVPLEIQSHIWSDKYRPRKPRFFNRVHTGFEWNKYNQTHYDMDNPPPKVVQGYKFNIFFPDLIDKSKAPTYTITLDENPDFAVLRFVAGPPYEDIAFKIVNKEWEYSYKKGFRCQFQNNIFQLWFHFKRYRYRR